MEYLMISRIWLVYQENSQLCSFVLAIHFLFALFSLDILP